MSIWAATPPSGSAGSAGSAGPTASAAVTARPPPKAAVKPATPEQQKRLKGCTADATQRSLKGAARRQYMTACMRRK
jgi:hypothetical protein